MFQATQPSSDLACCIHVLSRLRLWPLWSRCCRHARFRAWLGSNRYAPACLSAIVCAVPAVRRMSTRYETAIEADEIRIGRGRMSSCISPTARPSASRTLSFNVDGVAARESGWTMPKRA